MTAPKDAGTSTDSAAILALLRRYRLALIACFAFLIVLTRPLWGPEDPSTTFARETLARFSELERMLSDIGSLLSDAAEERRELREQAEAVNHPALIVAATDLRAALADDRPFVLPLAAYDGVASEEQRVLLDPLRAWSEMGVPSEANIVSQMDRILFTQQPETRLPESVKLHVQRARILLRAGKLSLSSDELSNAPAEQYPKLQRIRGAIIARDAMKIIRRKLNVLIVRVAGSLDQPAPKLD